VVGARLDLLDGTDIGCLRIPCQRQSASSRAAGGNFASAWPRDLKPAQETSAFHADPFAHQPGFAENTAHLAEFSGVAAVEGRQGVGQRGDIGALQLEW